MFFMPANQDFRDGFNAYVSRMVDRNFEEGVQNVSNEWFNGWVYAYDLHSAMGGVKFTPVHYW